MFLLRLLIRISGQPIIFPFYHTVSNFKLPHITHLYKVKNDALFEREIQFYLKYYRPLSLTELIDIVHNNRQINEPAFFLSFDDGLSQVYTNVYPVLKKYNVPAALFLNSAFIDNKAIFYRYKASLLVDLCSSTDQRKIKAYFGNIRSYNDLKKEIFKISYKEQAKLDEVAAYFAVDFNQYLHEHKPYLSSEQLFELAENGFYLGGHSIDHPDFHQISQEERLRQVKESVDDVQEKFNLGYRIFSFPFYDYLIDLQFFKMLQSIQIDLSFGTSGIKKDTAQFNLQRIPVEKSNLHAGKYIKRQYIKSVVQQWTGNNRLKRKI